MIQESFWKKKFSVGLTMDTSIKEFDAFLAGNEMYIDNIYVSLPLGDRFHGRKQIQNQFHNPENIALFWNLIRLIKSYHIAIEVVFNTEILCEKDIILSKEELERHEICVQKIAVLDKNYDIVKRMFPNIKVIKSVNEMPNTYVGLQNILYNYDEIVIGRHFIRDKKAHEIISKEKNAAVILLLNNGCSHICGGCDTFAHCQQMYLEASQRFSPEYLYALQSILPYELHDNYFDISNVSFFKLSTRNGDTKYLSDCLQSYINNDAEKYVSENFENYLLWSRLSWHMKYFKNFHYQEIQKIKKSICRIAL